MSIPSRIRLLRLFFSGKTRPTRSFQPCIFCALDISSHGPVTVTVPITVTVPSPVLVQKRHMAAKRAPSTRLKQRSAQLRPLTPQIIAQKQRIADLENLLAETSKINLVQKMAIFPENPGIAESFSDAFALFVAEFNRTRQTQEDFQDVIRRAYIFNHIFNHTPLTTPFDHP